MPHYLVKIEESEFDIEIEYRSEKYFAKINGKEVEIDCSRIGENRSILLIDGSSLEVDVRANGYDSMRTAFILGQEITVEIENYNLAQLKKTAGMSTDVKIVKILKAPMPGLILDVKVSAGDTVKKGDALLIIEAMKMENIIKASGDGIVKEVAVKNSQSVEKDDKLVEFE